MTINTNLIKKKFGRLLFYILILGIFLIAFYPVIWLYLGAFKNDAEFYTNIWGIPKVFEFNNFALAWERAALGRKYLNSIFVTLIFLAIILPVNLLAAYSLARLNFKGQKYIYNYLLIGIMIPVGVLAMPSFTVAVKLKLINSLVGLVLFYVAQNIAFGVFLMRSFFLTLPKSLEEASLIDGCTKVESFWHIILPLSKPGIMTQVIYCGLTVWNEYLLASLFIRKTDLQTLPLGLSVFVNQYNVYYPELFAALVLATFPMIILYVFGQKTFVEGMTAGAVKE